jgi:hypothetical protein
MTHENITEANFQPYSCGGDDLNGVWEVIVELNLLESRDWDDGFIEFGEEPQIPG